MMIRKILKWFLMLSVVVLVALAGLIYFYTRPTVDIDSYSQYMINNEQLPERDQVKVTFFGVSTLLLDDGQTQILIDGFFSRLPLLKIMFTDVESDTIQIDQVVDRFNMNRVKGIFVTHSHYDHAFDVAHITRRTGAKLYGSVSTLNIGRGGHVPESQLELVQPGDYVSLGEFTVQIIGSIHSPGNTQNDDGFEIEEPLSQPAKINRYLEGGSFDFYITHKGKRIYIKPSPNFIKGALEKYEADAVFIGMATVTNHPNDWQEDFYQENISKLNPSIVVPLHWDSFYYPVSDHFQILPRFATDGQKDFDFLISKTSSDNIDFKILQGTKSIVLF